MCKCFLPVLAAAWVSAQCLHGQEPPLTLVLSKNAVAEKRAAYSRTIEALESYRAAQWKEYQEANSSTKKEILADVRKRLTGDLCNEIFPAWYGTEWSSGGSSVQPGEGSISGWHFLATSLEHSGFKIDKSNMTRQPAEKIIVSMTKGKKFVLAGKQMKDAVDKLQKEGDGLYIVGLDRHIGFVSVKGIDVRFIHASYYKPNTMVMCEPATGENPFYDSRYRVFGKLMEDEMLVEWMKGEPFVVK